jgi:ribose transport system substrate-binding protein
MSSIWRAMIAAAVCLVAALSVAACGGSDDTGGGGASATTGSEQSETAASDPLIEEAQASVEEFSVNPGIGIDEPLPEPPPEGKTFLFLECSVPVCATIGDGMEQATQALGWELERKTFDLAQPESLVSLVDDAAANPPDYVALTTFPSEVWEAGLEKLKAQDVPVIVGSNATDEPLGEENGIYGNIASDPSEAQAGELKANWVIADSDGTGKMVHFATPDIVTTQAEADALEARMADCADCSLEIVDVASAELAGGKVPGKVVSYLQTNPDTEYISFAFGDMTAGLTGPLENAGFADQVKFVGLTPTLENLQSLKSGETQGAWLGWPAALPGWEFIDVAARLAAGADWEVAAEPVLPMRWLTQETIEEPIELYEPEGYQEAYQQLWGVQ